MRRAGAPTASRRAARAALLALVLAVPLACRSADTWSYDRPRATAAELDRDLTQCGLEARPTGVFAYPSMTGPDRDALNACMERRGYKVIRRPAAD